MHNLHHRFVVEMLMLPLGLMVRRCQNSVRVVHMCRGYIVIEGEEVLEGCHYKLQRSSGRSPPYQFLVGTFLQCLRRQCLRHQPNLTGGDA